MFLLASMRKSPRTLSNKGSVLIILEHIKTRAVPLLAGAGCREPALKMTTSSCIVPTLWTETSRTGANGRAGGSNLSLVHIHTTYRGAAVTAATAIPTKQLSFAIPTVLIHTDHLDYSVYPMGRGFGP